MVRNFTTDVFITSNLIRLAITAANHIGLQIAGVDILIDKDTYRICEINSSPGFQGFELATGIDVAKRIVEYAKFRTGVWQKTSLVPRRKALTVPVLAEHI